METIGICCDHAGYDLKELLKPYLLEKGIEVVDFGTNSNESCDYADFAHKLGAAIDGGELERGISICGSANGITMTMNKHQKVRAALCWKTEIAELARQHNNANVLSLPARFLTEEEAKQIVDVFFATDFEGGRHQARVDKIPV